MNMKCRAWIALNLSLSQTVIDSIPWLKDLSAAQALGSGKESDNDDDPPEEQYPVSLLRSYAGGSPTSSTTTTSTAPGPGQSPPRPLAAYFFPRLDSLPNNQNIPRWLTVKGHERPHVYLVDMLQGTRRHIEDPRRLNRVFGGHFVTCQQEGIDSLPEDEPICGP